jgi:hypothetical protein
MLPLVIFAIVYQQKQVDRKCIGSALGVISISYIATGLFSPQLYFASYRWSIFYIVPNVVTLSVFVFVFWPLLRNSWHPPVFTDDIQKKPGILARTREIIGEWIPRDAVTGIFMSMVILPTFLSLYVLVGSTTEIHNTIQLSGGLYFLTYDYREFGGSLYYPVRFLTIGFETATWPSVLLLGQWIINLYLGLITIQYIQRKTSKRRLNISVLLVILFGVVPSLIVSLFGIIFPVMGSLLIALPFYPIMMLLLAKFVHIQDASEKDLTKVPWRTRISSLFQRRSQDREIVETSEEIDEEGVVE